MKMLFFLILTLALEVATEVLPASEQICKYTLTSHGTMKDALNGWVAGLSPVSEVEDGSPILLFPSTPSDNYFEFQLYAARSPDSETYQFDIFNRASCGVEQATSRFICGLDKRDIHQRFGTSGVLASSSSGGRSPGHLLHDGSDNWLACYESVEESFRWAVYSDTKADQIGCIAISLSTGDCSYDEAPTLPKSTKEERAISPVEDTVANCPSDISSGPYEFPHLIVPTIPSQPNVQLGNSKSGRAYISPRYTTLFNFDIPSNYPRTCALVFQFPYGSDLAPGAEGFYFSGIEQEVGMHGGLEFSLLSGVANEGTSFASTPPVAVDFGKTEILPGEKYTIATFGCPTGRTVTFSGASRGNVELDYTQNARKEPIGLYVVPCS